MNLGFVTFPKFKHRMLSMDNLKRCLSFIVVLIFTLKFKQTVFFDKMAMQVSSLKWTYGDFMAILIELLLLLNYSQFLYESPTFEMDRFLYTLHNYL